ncbi:hypothetical protein R1A27_03490 [Methylobacterium sp. NMS12]|uniref:hypothetical protein n=1 Tax=Methylobacterium sp. NMS12 TaxID=3079766 RepID=UPI003F884629
MPETTPEAAIGGYVSVELAAKVAGISQNEMQRIAAAFAKGREEPWFGTILEVRTEKVMGRRHRDIRVSSLPATMRAALESDAYRFLLAAEQVAPGAQLRPQDFLLLHRAAHAEFGAPRLVSDIAAMMCEGARCSTCPARSMTWQWTTSTASASVTTPFRGCPPTIVTGSTPAAATSV